MNEIINNDSDTLIEHFFNSSNQRAFILQKKAIPLTGFKSPNFEINSIPDSICSNEVKNDLLQQLDTLSYNWDCNKIKYYECIENIELKLIFNHNKTGWNNFRQKFGREASLYSWSKPIFNKQRVYCARVVGIQSDYTLGAGFFILLKKIDNKWKVIYQKQMWIS